MSKISEKENSSLCFTDNKNNKKKIIYEEFIKKYTPNDFRSFVGNREHIKIVRDFIINYSKTDNSKKQMLIISGPSGIGKHLTLSMICSRYKLIAQYFNKNDTTYNTSVIELMTKKTSIMTFLCQDVKASFIVLDNLTREIYSSFIKVPSSIPIVIVSNNVHISMRKKCIEVKYVYPQKHCVAKLYRNILFKEGKLIDNHSANEIVIKTFYDMRHGLNVIYSILLIFWNKKIINYNDIKYILDTFSCKDTFQHFHDNRTMVFKMIKSGDYDEESLINMISGTISEHIVYENYTKTVINNDIHLTSKIIDLFSFTDTMKKWELPDWYNKKMRVIEPVKYIDNIDKFTFNNYLKSLENRCSNTIKRKNNTSKHSMDCIYIENNALNNKKTRFKL
ncbi:putative replication factor C subunit 1 [Heterosigma akashiwo virus 01]|uniref:Putative replication factor C subunit 1 n=1 Tax=Heterosigma akashiwo virus 01 TaxID=97195 RepID=A0A1C9C523_HAV01|nr:putative replication factor C subunit 1 [Heterosigma akashiwo virus 01]AOM63388.1 putative replication factor C subunit 1 [Heterosigma akashiwo virus 01]